MTGYRARNTVQVEIRNIDAVGRVIDAALGAGATNIGALGLYASSTDTARREAITKAVTKARAEAEAAARAAGGSLGPMIELTIDPYGLSLSYFFVTRNAMRRFCARPSSVVLSPTA